MATSPQPTRTIQPTSIAITSRVVNRAEALETRPSSKGVGSALLIERVVLVALDIAMVNLAFYLAWYARYRWGLFLALDPGNYVEHDVYMPLQATLSVTFAAMLALRGLYRLPRAASALDDLSAIFT